MGLINTRTAFMAITAGAFFLNQFLKSEMGEGIAGQAREWYNNVAGDYFPQLKPRAPEIRCGMLHWSNMTLLSQRVVLFDGVRPAAVYIEGGKIARIANATFSEGHFYHPGTQDKFEGEHVLNFKDLVISPGVIDVHVHLNEPGREEWEGIQTGTAAAAVGGVTTVVDMPLNSNPTTTLITRLLDKQDAARGKALVDIAMWAGLVPANAGNYSFLDALLYGGALGFKAFMCPSGINDFEHVTEKDIKKALPFLKRRGAPLYVHAEVVSELQAEGKEGEKEGDCKAKDPTLYSTYMATRPPSFEYEAIKLLIQILDEDESPAAHGFSVHIAHLADAGSLELLKDAKTRHPITVETCPHYLNFADVDVEKGDTFMKCAPPIRGAANRDALLSAVASGEISLIGSDHSPAPPELKEIDSGDFLAAWGGISGLQYTLPATWTALRKVGVDLLQLSKLLSVEPARLAGLSRIKGRIAEGYDADLVIWDPDSPANTSMEMNMHRHKLSPYTDMKLDGKVMVTLVRGQFVRLFDATTRQACGNIVKRQKP